MNLLRFALWLAVGLVTFWFLAFFWLDTIHSTEMPCDPISVTHDGVVTVDWPCAQRLAHYGAPAALSTKLSILLLTLRNAAAAKQKPGD